VREAGGEVAHLAGVDHQDVVPQWFVRVLLQVDIVELGNVVLQLLLLQHLLDEVLTVVPTPRLVDLPEVLYDETALRNAAFVDADCTLPLRVHAETRLVLGQIVVAGQQIRVLVVPLRKQLQSLFSLLRLLHLLRLFPFIRLFPLGGEFGVGLDVLAAFEEVVSLCAHEVEGAGEAVLNEIVPACFIRQFLDAVDVKLGEAVVDDVPGEEVDAPGEPFLDLRLLGPVVHQLPRTQLTVVLPDLAVPATLRPVLVGVGALDLPGTVGALAFPADEQGVLAEVCAFGEGVEEADAGVGAVEGLLVGLEAVVDDGGALGRGGYVAVDLLVLAEGGGNYWPLLHVGLVLRLVLDQPRQVRLLDLEETPEYLSFQQHGHDLFVEDGEVLEGSQGASTEELVPGDEATQVTFEVERTGVEVGLAVQPHLVDADYLAAANILQHPGL
jgi:hypothetical protein